MRIWQWGDREFVQEVSLLQAFGITPLEKRIALVGAGGKTTLLFALAEELCRQGRRVIVTTSTHIRRPEGFFITGSDRTGALRALDEQGVVVLGSGVPQRKLCAPEAAFLAELAEHANHVLIEADGSRMLPAKAPADHEPVLDGDEALVIAVTGWKAFGHRIQEVCHRPERVMSLLGKAENAVLTPADAALLLASPQGGRKLVKHRFAAVINQVDGAAQLRDASLCAVRLRTLLAPDCRILALGREEAC